MKEMRNTLRRTVGKSARLAIAISLGMASSLAAAADYEIVDLGANVTPRDININRVIVGARNTDQYPNIAFRWTPADGFEDLNGTAANAINDNGKIAGSTLTGAFVLDGGNFRSWDDHRAFGINQIGDVSGSKAGNNPYRPTSIPYNPAVLNGSRWTVMDIAKVYPRGTRQGVYADIYTLVNINDTGYTVGSRRRYGLSGSSAILISPSYSDIKDAADVTYLPTPAGGVANAINDQNLIVGTTGNSSSAGLLAFAFLYDGLDVINLGTLNGGLRSGAADINNLNEIVGYSETSTGNHAFVWNTESGLLDLNEFIAAPGWVLSTAIAISDAGDIVGTGLLNGQPHGFLLTTDLVPPTPNEQSIAVATADVTKGKAPLSVNFSGDGSSDPDGAIASYSWDFGDGTSASEANPPSHIYTVPDTYIVMLTVTDDLGMTDSANLEITVRKSKGKP